VTRSSSEQTREPFLPYRLARAAPICKSGPVRSSDLTIVDGSAAGAWIRPKLGGRFGAVTRQVPKGFDAYVRIFHPASDPAGNPVAWADVARVRGTTPHSEMQWHAILGLRSADELRSSYRPGDGSGVNWAGSDPPIGGMDLETLDALCEVLAAHTADTTQCFFGLCAIHSWLDSFADEELLPLLELPWDRKHIVLSGPLSAVNQILYDWSNSLQFTFTLQGSEGLPPKQDPMELLQREAPNLIWPEDRSWFVASEVDFDSTLVGGTAALVDGIRECATLEARRVKPTDSLADDADKINRLGAD
jgi:hypothetical protein